MKMRLKDNQIKKPLAHASGLRRAKTNKKVLVNYFANM